MRTFSQHGWPSNDTYTDAYSRFYSHAHVPCNDMPAQANTATIMQTAEALPKSDAKRCVKRGFNKIL